MTKHKKRRATQEVTPTKEQPTGLYNTLKTTISQSDRMEMACEFLSYLDPESLQFTFQTFDDLKSRKDPELAKVFNGSLEEHWGELDRLNKKGAGIFVTVQKTDLKGRKKDNIIGIRCLFIEDDRGGLPELPIEPHIEVESSPGKHHRYISLENDVPLDEFEGVQRTLVDDYGSDPNARDRARVLRLPGFYHKKNPDQPHLVSISKATPLPRWEWSKIKELFPPVEISSQNYEKGLAPSDGKIVRIALVSSALKTITPDLEYIEWLKVGIALHMLSGGGEEGLQMWDKWSSEGSSYNEGECEYRYSTFSDREGVTGDYLYKVANGSGWKGNYDPNEELVKKEYRRVLEDMNKKHGLVVIDGQARIVKGGLDSTKNNNPKYDFMSESSAKSLLANVKTPLFTPVKGEKRASVKMKEVFPIWMRSGNRRTYKNGIEYAPERRKIAKRKKYEELPKPTNRGKLNLYRGLAVVPVEGDCSLILAHIKEILCSSYEDEYTYFINWLARLVQYPDDMGHTVPVLKSGQGAGKNIIIDMVVGFFGIHGITVTDEESVTGKFNSHLATSSVAFLNEAVWAGNKPAEGRLKALITDDKIMFEEKYLPKQFLGNKLHLIIASNNDWCAPAEMDDRRFFFLTVSDTKRDDFDYFKRLDGQIENGGAAAFLKYLMDRDIAKFHPRNLPNNSSQVKAENKLRSAGSVTKWWHAKCYDACIQSEVFGSGAEETEWERGNMLISKEQIYANYEGWCRKKGERAEVNSLFHKKLKAITPSEMKETRPRIEEGGARRKILEIPSLFFCRCKIDDLLGGENFKMWGM